MLTSKKKCFSYDEKLRWRGKRYIDDGFNFEMTLNYTSDKKLYNTVQAHHGLLVNTFKRKVIVTGRIDE